MTRTIRKPMKEMTILAGGRGTRLGDLTKDCQKCMVDINGKPFLALLIDKYRAEGFTDFKISTGYLAEQVESYDFGDNVRFVRDLYTGNGWGGWSTLWYYDTKDNMFPGSLGWVVNGDTYIPDSLPDTAEPTICIADGIDAGAQYVAFGKITVHTVSAFYDIGTPEGLNLFKSYWVLGCGSKA